MFRHTGLHTHTLKRQSLGDQYPTYNITIPVDHFKNDAQYAPHTDANFTAFYKIDTSLYQAGGPVLVSVMGEDSFSYHEGYFQTGLIHQIANATGGIMVAWAQRYYSGGDIVPQGEPYTTKNLRFHSTPQAMADLAYFSKHVKFAGLESKNLTAPGTPWVLIAGSYGGVISAFSRIQYARLFWVRKENPFRRCVLMSCQGALSSSGVTVPIIDAWRSLNLPVRRQC